MFAGVGVLSLGADLFTLRLLLTLDVPRYVAVTGAFFLSIVVHFTLNKYVSFQNFDKNVHYQMGKYLGVVGLCYALTIVCIAIGVSTFSLSTMAAKLLSVLIVYPVSFTAHRYFTFRQATLPESAPESH